ncbi:glycine-rich domain-containing protein [Hyphomonas sp.]|uniref:glycine-rich domain-containing protein n=1 Tax=Hyphomonas sp. TaxID=87 RepID=UPI0025C50E65|nr:hypothetical protein [Hyphomonas sp.]
MSEIQANSIGKYSGNNVSLSDPLKFKSYTTTQRDALSSVAGDVIYNTTTQKLELFTNGAWTQMGGIDAFSLEYLLVAGGGGGGSGRNSQSGGSNAGGGGAGGLLSNVSGDNTGGGVSAQPAFYAVTGQAYRVRVGAGGLKGEGAYAQQPSNERSGRPGTRSQFHEFKARGGGAGAGRNFSYSSGTDDRSLSYGTTGGSGGGGHTGTANNSEEQQGYDGGAGNNSNYNAGGGGGAGAVGGTWASGAVAGTGITSSILTTTEATAESVGVVSSGYVYFAGGGGGGGNTNNGAPAGGLGGGGRGSSTNADNGVDGTANTGGGGGGGASRTDGYGWDGSNGGSGVVILRYPSDFTCTVGAGLTQSTNSPLTQGTKKVTILTAGLGTVTFS